MKIPHRWLLVTILALLPLGAKASPMSEADGLFEKGLYDQALKKYETVLITAKGDTRLAALYRAAESQALLFRYQDAAKSVLDAPLPASPLWKARFLLLRAELSREFLKQYGFAAPKNVEEGNPDLARRTPSEWRAIIEKSYEALLPLKAKLLAVPLSTESYFIEVKDTDLAAVPTLWDFVVERWTSYLLGESEATGKRPEPGSFLAETFPAAMTAVAPATQAGALFESAWKAGGKSRRVAREIWRTQRALIPFSHPDKVARVKDTKTLETRGAKLLERWTKTFATARGKAAAAAEAARLYNEAEAFSQAVALCRRVEKAWPQTPSRPACTELRLQIETPRLTLESRPAPPPGKGALILHSRNLSTIYLRLYPTSVDELKALSPAGMREDWSFLKRLTNDGVQTFLKQKPALEWSVAVASKKPFAPSNTEIAPPKNLDSGLYVVAASSDSAFSPKRAVTEAGIINVTRLLLFGSAGPKTDGGETSDALAPGFRLYSLDGAGGHPVGGVAIDATLRADWGSPRHLEARTDKNGIALIDEKALGAGKSFSLDPLAVRENDHALWAQAQYVSESERPLYKIAIDIDRPIYRPGQKVIFKVTVLKRTPRGWHVKDGGKIDVVAKDSNGDAVYKAGVGLNGMGSVSKDFAVPEGRLLGKYSLTASFEEDGKKYYGAQGFAVEEYKRPAFEVKIAEPSGAFQYGKTATIQGTASYYFGAPVPDAPIQYRIERRPFFPWFWWGFRPPGLKTQEVASGEARSDGTGHFSFTFVPEPGDEIVPGRSLPSHFVIHCSARDAGGRTITAERTVAAGEKAFLVDVSPVDGFLRAGKEGELTARVVNLNEQPAATSADYQIFELTEAPPEKTALTEEPMGFSPSPGPSIDELYEKVPNGPKKAEGHFECGVEKPARVPLSPLPQGIYRVTVSAKDPFGGRVAASRILAVADPAKPDLKILSVSLAEHSSYTVGEKAQILLGSSFLTENTFVEIWRGQSLKETRTLKGGAQLVEVPIEEADRGGLTVRWFGAHDFHIRRGETRIDVPWKDRELTISLDSPKRVAPGAKQTWRLTVKDAEGKPIDGEATLKVYDRALEYYAKEAASWVSSLYPPSENPAALETSYFALAGSPLPVEQAWIDKLLGVDASSLGKVKELPLPAIRSQRSRVGSGFGFRRRHETRFGYAGSAIQMMAADSRAAAPVSNAKNAVEGGAPEGTRPAPAPRANFAETALFAPEIKIEDGGGEVSFTMPESLTSFRISGYALTSDVKEGTLESEAVTAKDLMVSLEMPRFFREGDEGVIKALLHNETDRKLSGNVTLNLTGADGKNVFASWGMKDPERGFEVPPHGVTAISYRAFVPRGIATVKVRVIARSNELSDAEERELPVLPSRERLVASDLVSLDGNSKGKLTLPQAARQGTVESATLEIDPELAIPILRSLPFLVRYPFECTEQALNRYVPLAIVRAIFLKNPEIAKAAAKLPKRTTVHEPWDKNDPRRELMLVETPWLAQSRGTESAFLLIDLFDTDVVAKEGAAAVAQLKSYQLPDGAFPWFPGGSADPYMTLYVLEGIAQAQSFGAAFPEDLTKRAFQYALKETTERLKPDEGSLALTLYAAYVLTSFNAPWAKPATTAARVWAEFAEKHSRALTPLGRAYLAHVYHRLGDEEKASSYLDRALDGARESETVGVYWAPEKMSWLWYNDTLEKEAFFLRTLVELRPKDPRIPGIVKWILFNRKGNEWRSTKNSAAAIYSLLDLMQSRGSLEKPEVFRWQWGSRSETVTLEPMETLEKLPRWSLPTETNARELSIDKQGPGMAWASLTTIFSTDKAPETAAGKLLRMERSVFLRVKQGNQYHLKRLPKNATVKVGDQIEVHLTISAESAFEYVHVKAPKAAGFEPEALRSGWKWDTLARYEELTDSTENFFLSWVPHGEYVLSYRLRAVTPGDYKFGSAVIQSMYAPDFAGYSEGLSLKIVE